jgi:hypothetical protein
MKVKKLKDAITALQITLRSDGLPKAISQLPDGLRTGVETMILWARSLAANGDSVIAKIEAIDSSDKLTRAGKDEEITKVLAAFQPDVDDMRWAIDTLAADNANYRNGVESGRIGVNAKGERINIDDRPKNDTEAMLREMQDQEARRMVFAMEPHERRRVAIEHVNDRDLHRALEGGPKFAPLIDDNTRREVRARRFEASPLKESVLNGERAVNLQQMILDKVAALKVTK